MIACIDRVRATSASAMMAIGVILVVAAVLHANWIPYRAHDDFGALVRSQGGSLSHSETYPDTYRLMSAQRRMLQNAYVGVSGLVLLTVGAVGLTRADTDRASLTSRPRASEV
jgi:hypothetical protein